MKFDAAFLIIHGTPAEDGKIQAYLDMKNIPYNGCSSFVCALTFDKYTVKRLLATMDVPMADMNILRKEDFEKEMDLSTYRKWEYPLFTKPNKNGSSYGVSKVYHYDELEKAIEEAFRFDDEVLVESFLDGRECSCGVYMDDEGEIIALPITEIIPDGEFFDYEAKYKNKSQEITPADFSQELTTKCQELTIHIYKELKCRGCVRIDYILVGDTFNFIEVNTLPGLSPQSMIPQQIEAAGLNVYKFLRREITSRLP